MYLIDFIHDVWPQVANFHFLEISKKIFKWHPENIKRLDKTTLQQKIEIGKCGSNQLGKFCPVNSRGLMYLQNEMRASVVEGNEGVAVTRTLRRGQRQCPSPLVPENSTIATLLNYPTIVRSIPSHFPMDYEFARLFLDHADRSPAPITSTFTLLSHALVFFPQDSHISTTPVVRIEWLCLATKNPWRDVICLLKMMN